MATTATKNAASPIQRARGFGGAAIGERQYDQQSGCASGEEGALTRRSLENAPQLVHLYAERGSPKYERAAMRWLERYLTEGTPRRKSSRRSQRISRSRRLRNFASYLQIEERELEAAG